MKPLIEVIVADNGEIKIDALGFKGADCEKATRYLEDALGAVSATVKKPEYHQHQSNKQQQRIGS
jgi:hypothetical protein